MEPPTSINNRQVTYQNVPIDHAQNHGDNAPTLMNCCVGPRDGAKLRISHAVEGLTIHHTVIANHPGAEATLRPGILMPGSEITSRLAERTKKYTSNPF